MVLYIGKEIYREEVNIYIEIVITHANVAWHGSGWSAGCATVPEREGARAGARARQMVRTDPRL